MSDSPALGPEVGAAWPDRRRDRMAGWHGREDGCLPQCHAGMRRHRLQPNFQLPASPSARIAVQSLYVGLTTMPALGPVTSQEEGREESCLSNSQTLFFFKAIGFPGFCL